MAMYLGECPVYTIMMIGMPSSAIYASKLSNSATMYPGECSTTNTINTSKKENHGYPILTHGIETIQTMPRQGEMLLVIWLVKPGCLLSLYSTKVFKVASWWLELEDGGASFCQRIWARGMKTYLSDMFPNAKLMEWKIKLWFTLFATTITRKGEELTKQGHWFQNLLLLGGRCEEELSTFDLIFWNVIFGRWKSS